MTIEEIISKKGLSHRITTILEYHYDQIIRDIRAELPNNESEEESLPIDHLYTVIFTAILLNQNELLIAVFDDLNEVKLEDDAPDYNEDQETWKYIHTKGQEFRINNTRVIFYYS